MGVSSSWPIVKSSFRVLRQDPELFWLPPIALLAFLVLLACVLPLAVLFSKIAPDDVAGLAAVLVWLYAYFLGMTFIAVLLNAMVVVSTSERLQGAEPTLSSTFRRVWALRRKLLAWSLLATTIAFVIAAISRFGTPGRVLAWTGGIAWNLATFFIIPTLVLERGGIGASLRRSGSTFTSVWGESLAGIGGLGILGLLAFLYLFLGLAFFVGSAGMLSELIGATQRMTEALMVTAMVLWGTGLLALVGLAAVLHGIYKAALYEYARHGRMPEPFQPPLPS